MGATTFLKQKFPDSVVKFDYEFEGMESKVVFSVTNGSIGTSPSIIPVSLTRANNHLVIFTEDFRDIFKDATEKNLAKKSKIATAIPVSCSNAITSVSASVKEASAILASLARRLPLESLASLAQEWGVRDLYGQMVAQDKTRVQMIEALTNEYLQNNPEVSLPEFLEILASVNMDSAVKNKMKDNLTTATNDLKERVKANTLTGDEMVGVAHSLGQRSLFTSLTRPLQPPALPDQEALLSCLQAWQDQATEMTSSDDLLACLRNVRLFSMAGEIKAKLENSVDDDMDSFENMTLKDKIGATAIDVFLPVLTTLLTIAYLALLNGHLDHLAILLLIHWIPSLIFFSIHLYFNHSLLGTTLNLTKTSMASLILLQPVSSTGLHVLYLQKRARYTGQEVERYKMRKLLQLAESSVLMNNFTSMLVIVFTLHLANTGTINVANPALFSVSTTTTVLHGIKLLLNIIKGQSPGDSSMNGFVRSTTSLS